MLVLGRKASESVVLHLPDGNEIEVTVIEINGRGQVRLGFDAPEDVLITRTELLEAV
uniref:carbon storage regulator n=1 Tax=Cellvibrio fontiphilus TaxID=1815559 RepID=UPI002B4BF28E|nr:carbon storage regulator [Cellvibrio fontiphilus]